MPIAFFRNGVCVPLVTTPGLRVADVDIVAVARDAAVEHFEADDLAADAVGLLLAQDAGADEVVLLPADDPAQVGFERRRRLVDVVAVEAHRRLRGAACRARRGRRE